MVNLEGVSTSAKIGQVVIIVGLIIVGISLPFWIVMTGLGFSQLVGPNELWGLSSIAGILAFGLPLAIIAWSILAVFAIRAASNDNFERAAKLAAGATFLPPLHPFYLVGAVLLWISPEVQDPDAHAAGARPT